MNEIEKKIKAAEDKLAQIVAAAEVDGGLTDEQQAEIDTLETELSSLDAQKTRLAAINAKLAERAPKPQPRKVQAGGGAPVAAPSRTEDLSKDDPKCGYKSHTEFLLSVIEAGKRGTITDDRLRNLTAGADEQSTFSDSYGGFLIPEAFRPSLLTLNMMGDPTSGRTTRIPMSGPSVKIPARTDKNHSSSVSGGLRVYRRAESQTVSSSRMQVERITLELHSLMGLAYATDEILRFSPISFAALLENGFRDEFAATVLNEKIRGTGVGEFEGILNSPALISVDKESGQSADTVLFANIKKMRARCYGYGNAIWLYNPDTLVQLMDMADDFGRFIWQPSARDGEPDRLLGRPAFECDYCSTLGDAGDIILADWSQYLEAEMGGVEMAQSMHVRFENKEETFRFSVMNDGRGWWRSAFTPAVSSTTRSPFVTLAARA